jgi:hypothetical protein
MAQAATDPSTKYNKYLKILSENRTNDTSPSFLVFGLFRGSLTNKISRFTSRQPSPRYLTGC